MRDDQCDARRGKATETAGEDEDGGVENGLREDGPAGRSGANFDPTPYLRQLRGRGAGQDYLDVKWRLLWLRREHPDAEILTEHVQIDQTTAIFKATVTLPTGGKATGYGSETATDFGDFIEKAETKAIGRALNALGYGAQFGERSGDEEGATYPRPVDGLPSTPDEASSRPVAGTVTVGGAATQQGVDRSDAAGAGRGAPPIDFPTGRQQATERPTGQAVRGPAAPGGQADPADEAGSIGSQGHGPEPELADYSWSAFWPWARGLGLNGPKAVEALIGRPTAGLTPAELRDLIVAARDGD